jgi:hypothetical protein
MKCPACNGSMTLLFLSAVCEFCDSKPKVETAPDRGWITWRSRPAGSCEYVFKTPGDAERWRDASGLTKFPIRSVLTSTPFRWRKSTGTVRDIELADRLFEVHPEPISGPNCVWLEPK